MALEKIEKRGKYAGVKAHLSGPECQMLLDWRKKAKQEGIIDTNTAVKFVKDLAKAIDGLQQEYPDLLKDREPEEVEAALKKDAAKIAEQLAALNKGKDWKQVK